MTTIFLPRKKIKRFTLDGKKLHMTLDAGAIDYFQKTTKKGFLEFQKNILSMQKTGEIPICDYIQLLGACVKYKNGQSVGVKFFEKYDDLMIINELMPLLAEMHQDNLPHAKDEAEKK